MINRPTNWITPTFSLMTLLLRFRYLTAFLWLFSFLPGSYAQNKIDLTDARQGVFGDACDRIIDSWPKEVLMGVMINEQGEVFFSMTGGPWFDQLFTSARDGIAVDLVTKDQYDCTHAQVPSGELPRGQFMAPLYLDQLKKNMLERNGDQIYIRIGLLPIHLKKRIKELEGNLAILKNGQICHYKHFTDIDRSLWQLLPMGLYTDTLISTDKILQTQQFSATACDRKLEYSIPFEKGKSSFPASALRHLPDSLLARDYYVKKIDLRVYSSVEGSEDFNDELGSKRTEAVQALLKKYVDPYPLNSYPMSWGNWDDFLKDIEHTPYASWMMLSDSVLEARLKDKKYTKLLEPMLKKHRKAVITLYLDKKSRMDRVTGDSLAARFRQAVAEKKIFKASLLLEDVIARVADARLPAAYLDSLEIPREKDFSALLADKATYQFIYGQLYESEALENFKALLEIDSSSSRIHYNVCALSLSMWQYDTTILETTAFLREIQGLYRRGVDSSLVMRMLVNYHVINSEHSMRRADYATKDRSVTFVSGNYATRQLSEEDMLSLAKYLCYYSQRPLALAMVQDRLQRGPVKEDLLFYYLNMQIFGLNNREYTTVLKKEIATAIGMNRQRFCKFFNSNNNGGASFQLLAEPSMRTLYCEQCKAGQ